MHDLQTIIARNNAEVRRRQARVAATKAHADLEAAELALVGRTRLASPEVRRAVCRRVDEAVARCQALSKRERDITRAGMHYLATGGVRDTHQASENLMQRQGYHGLPVADWERDAYEAEGVDPARIPGRKLPQGEDY